MNTPTVTTLLSRWPSRKAVLEDAAQQKPDLKIVAVHRWAQRGAIPAQYWHALLSGAQRRGIDLTADELLVAHAANDGSRGQIA